MVKIKIWLRNIATISPRSIGYLIIIGGWEPIYQLLRLVDIVGSEFSGFFISVGFISAALVFAIDYARFFKIRNKDL